MVPDDLPRQPVEVQLAAFSDMIAGSDVLTPVLAGARELGLPGWYLTAGAVFQTVWNTLTGESAAHGIRDYDLAYFDSDTSWEAEDAVIRRAAARFGDRPVEARNQARVHRWYERRFGTPCAPFASTEDAIRAFPATTCSFGVRLEDDDHLTVYAPYGFGDLFAFVVRPNPVLAPRAVYEAKAARWRALWPHLDVLPWPA